MKPEQYEKYTKLKEEIKPLKNFLKWCGKKYKDNSLNKYQYQMHLYKRSFFGSAEDNLYEIPLELQGRIIETIENYVEEKEKEMEEI